MERRGRIGAPPLGARRPPRGPRAACAAREAVAAERARVARELHDVVAHSVSIIAVQAGAAESLMDRDPERAREHIGAVRRTAGEALIEMRRLLGVLREDEAVYAPQPTLGDLERLVGEVRATGVPVELVREGDDAGPLPAGIDLAAYRIVQEALTNVRRHAGAAPDAGRRAPRARRRRRGGGRTPRPTAPGEGPGGGHGLRGHARAGAAVRRLPRRRARARTAASRVRARLPVGERRVIRIVIADDHALIRGGLAGMLGAEDDIEVVGEAADGAEAVDLVLRERPDVVVMDIRMPVMDGIAATRRLGRARPGGRGSWC